MPRNRRYGSQIEPKSATKILRILSPQEYFLFFTDIGQYTGEFAQSLEDFYGKISRVPLKSLDFHFRRGDFEKWIRKTLGDAYLADRINRINKSIQMEKLRTILKRIVKRRLNQLATKKIKLKDNL